MFFSECFAHQPFVSVIELGFRVRFRVRVGVRVRVRFGVMF